MEEVQLDLVGAQRNMKSRLQEAELGGRKVGHPNMAYLARGHQVGECCGQFVGVEKWTRAMQQEHIDVVGMQALERAIYRILEMRRAVIIVLHSGFGAAPAQQLYPAFGYNLDG